MADYEKYCDYAQSGFASTFSKTDRVLTNAPPPHILKRIEALEANLGRAEVEINGLKVRVNSLEKELRGYTASEAESAGPAPATTAR